MQLHTNIRIEPDGSATVTERLRLSRKLLDLGKERIESNLNREEALRRMKAMGEGLSLVSHKVSDVEEGAREMLTVYKTKDINKLIYASPFLSYWDHARNNSIQFELNPVYESTWYGRKAGEMRIALKRVPAFPDKAPTIPKPKPRKEGEPEPKGPSPQELQSLRGLSPVFRDILKGFEIKLSFETYNHLRAGFGNRDKRSGTRYVELLHLSDTSLDTYGYNFMDNEEAMLSILRGDLGSKVIVDQVKGWTTNRTLPVYHPWGSKAGWWLASREIYFRPSRQLFDRYFTGKTLVFKKGEKRAADFKEIGWKKK
ncbi:MAG: hypothetical protein QGF00_17775 [Planctomycetota bacterium]|nr:hypothetical protein [Planctomycetota bacterium]MDP7251462.1 hypothetical protein [Planctomycetota bacterium]